METEKVEVGTLEVGDYIIAEIIAPTSKYGFMNRPTCWLVDAIHRSGDIIFLNCMGYQEGSTTWFNYPSREFKFTMPSNARVDVLKRKK